MDYKLLPDRSAVFEEHKKLIYNFPSLLSKSSRGYVKLNDSAVKFDLCGILKRLIHILSIARVASTTEFLLYPLHTIYFIFNIQSTLSFTYNHHHRLNNYNSNVPLNSLFITCTGKTSTLQI